MNRRPLESLSRREREVMEIVYAGREVTAKEVLKGLADPPSYSAVRTTLRILEEKGHVVHEQEGPRYVYRPALPLEQARTAALDGVVRTFFRGSVGDAIATLLRLEDAELPEERLERLAAEIEAARKEGR